MRDQGFDRKVTVFASALGDAYRAGAERGDYPELELTEDGLTEDFTAMLWAQMGIYRRITGEDVDILGFVGILNRLAVQKVMGQRWAGAAGRKDYGHAAAYILDALYNGRVPISWHEIDRVALEREVGQALARLDGEREDG